MMHRMSIVIVATSAVLTSVTGSLAQPLIGGDLPGTLVDMDRDTATTTALVNLAEQPQGLAYDPVSDQLYGISAGSDTVYTIDFDTGATATLATLPFGNANGLAYDTSRDLLFGADNNSNSLFTVDPSTGVVVTIGNIANAGGVEGLAYDPETDTLYGLSDIFDELVIIDPNTAAATVILSNMPAVNWRGLAYDPTRRALYASVSVSGSLYRIDNLDSSPSLTEIGTINPDNAVQGLAFRAPALLIDATCPGPAEACVAGNTPGDQVAIIYGLGVGSGPPVPGCPGVNVDIVNPTIAGVGNADGSGLFCVQGNLPPAACGNVVVQGVNVTQCVVTGYWGL